MGQKFPVHGPHPYNQVICHLRIPVWYVITCKFVSKLFSAMQDNQQKIILETKHDENRHSSLPIIVHVSNIWSFNIWSTLLCLNLEGTLKRKKMYTLFLPLLYSYILAIKVFTTLFPRTMHI